MEEPTITRSELWRGRLQRFRKGIKVAAPFASGVLAALTALLLYRILFPSPHQLTQNEFNDSVSNVLASATPQPAFSARVYQVIQPSLVLIETQGSDSNGKEEDGLGSGIVVDDRGDILTSLHVVANASNIQVIFADGTKSDAHIIARQSNNDIAVLQAEILPQILIPATLGNPGAMNVGDDAYVVGNPFGLYSSMSAGVISGFDRTFKLPDSDIKMHGMIQIDAAVNPGNSGGPLLNRDGYVVGIVTGIVNPTKENFFIGIGFAVPINVAVRAAGSPPY